MDQRRASRQEPRTIANNKGRDRSAKARRSERISQHVQFSGAGLLQETRLQGIRAAKRFYGGSHPLLAAKSSAIFRRHPFGAVAGGGSGVSLTDAGDDTPIVT